MTNWLNSSVEPTYGDIYPAAIDPTTNRIGMQFAGIRRNGKARGGIHGDYLTASDEEGLYLVGGSHPFPKPNHPRTDHPRVRVVMAFRQERRWVPPHESVWAVDHWLCPRCDWTSTDLSEAVAHCITGQRVMTTKDTE